MATHRRGAVVTALGFVSANVAKVGQRIQAVVADQNDTATVTTIAAIGAALGNKFLTHEMHDAVAAVARYDLYGDFINKSHNRWRSSGKVKV